MKATMAVIPRAFLVFSAFLAPLPYWREEGILFGKSLPENIVIFLRGIPCSATTCARPRGSAMKNDIRGSAIHMQLQDVWVLGAAYGHRRLT